VILGFTGTQVGMTDEQVEAFVAGLLFAPWIEALHHGCCVGADAQAHGVALGLGIPVVLHPPEQTGRMARLTGEAARLEPRPYLDRNHDIVDACDVLVAAPQTLDEVLRSGTWATVRYARKIGRPVILLPV
jgi:hypothetical protein